MLVTELEELVRRAESVLGCPVYFSRRSDGQFIARKTGLANEDLSGGTMNDLIETLRRWATPPKPKTVTIEIPFEAAGWAASIANNVIQDSPKAISDACVAALKPWATV